MVARWSGASCYCSLELGDNTATVAVHAICTNAAGGPTRAPPVLAPCMGACALILPVAPPTQTDTPINASGTWLAGMRRLGRSVAALVCCLLLLAACQAADDKQGAAAGDQAGQKGGQAEVRACPAQSLLAACCTVLLQRSKATAHISEAITAAASLAAAAQAHPPPLPPTLAPSCHRTSMHPPCPPKHAEEGPDAQGAGRAAEEEASAGGCSGQAEPHRHEQGGGAGEGWGLPWLRGCCGLESLLIIE